MTTFPGRYMFSEKHIRMTGRRRIRANAYSKIFVNVWRHKIAYMKRRQKKKKCVGKFNLLTCVHLCYFEFNFYETKLGVTEGKVASANAYALRSGKWSELPRTKSLFLNTHQRYLNLIRFILSLNINILASNDILIKRFTNSALYLLYIKAKCVRE